jgi:hypothetical protein
MIFKYPLFSDNQIEYINDSIKNIESRTNYLIAGDPANREKYIAAAEAEIADLVFKEKCESKTAFRRGCYLLIVIGFILLLPLSINDRDPILRFIASGGGCLIISGAISALLNINIR